MIIFPLWLRRGATDLPDGLDWRFAVQSFLRKFFTSPLGRNSFIDSSHPVPREGRIAIVTDVGCGMRWTRQRRRT
jgi:hypothetical protein